MKLLNDILNSTPSHQVKGNTEIAIHHICFDSREVSSNSLFVALKGTLADGHDFIYKAISAGANAIACERLPDTLFDNVTYIVFSDTSKALGFLVCNFFEHPSRKLNLIGVTGTNGKTTIATLLYRLFKQMGYKAGLISTIRYLIDNKEYKASHTTPDSVRINTLLDEMVEIGCEYCFMEVSSHAIHQGRINGLQFKGGIFTNITHDHLDYHSTFKDYIDTKKAFFDGLPQDAFALGNKDDKNGKVMLQNTKAGKYFYSIDSVADFSLKIIESHFDGMMVNIQGKELWTSFIGRFNASNLLAVYASAILMRQSSEDVLPLLSNLRSVDGRFETIKSENGITAIVDYAHTPDALKNILQTIAQLRKGHETLFVVVGAGGNRDKTKRPEMGKMASEFGDKIILTSDNPRNEDPVAIIEEVKKGIITTKINQTLSITDRKEAIRTALMMAKSNDIVLVAGKGHETYQEIKGVRYDFDDRKVIREYFNENK